MTQSPEFAASDEFTFEGLVAARHLAALLCEHAWQGMEGAIVSAAAVRYFDFRKPQDDVIINYRQRDRQAGRLSLEAKRNLFTTCAADNDDDRKVGLDSAGKLNITELNDAIVRLRAATEPVATGAYRTLTTLCEHTRGSPISALASSSEMWEVLNSLSE